MVTIEMTHTIRQDDATLAVLDALETRILAERKQGKVTCATRHWQQGDTFVYVEIHDATAQRRQASEVARVKKETDIRVEKKVRAEQKKRLTSENVRRIRCFTMNTTETNQWVGAWLEVPICPSSSETMCKAMLFPYPNEARALLVRYPPGTVVLCDCGKGKCTGQPMVVVDAVPGPNGHPVLVATDRPGGACLAFRPNEHTKTLGYKQTMTPLVAMAIFGRRGVA